MRKSIILIIGILLGAALIGTGWLEYRNTKVIEEILNNYPYIDSISVKDGKTKEEILTFTSLDPSFSDTVELYKLSYHGLKWSERKLLKGKPYIEVDYIKNNEVMYKVSVYEVEEEHTPMLPNDISTASRSYSFSYSPEKNNTTYIFAIKDNYSLLGVNEGFKELLNKVTQTSLQK